MDDLISRADAIRWVKTECNPYGKPTLDFESGKKVIAYLERLPSAQPIDGQEAYYRGKIDGIKECTTRLKKMNEEIPVVNNSTTEMIRRSEVMDCREIINGLPSAQPQRMRGKWIKLYEGNYKCSECGDWWGNDDNNMVESFHYCPNCGAWMGAQDAARI